MLPSRLSHTLAALILIFAAIEVRAHDWTVDETHRPGSFALCTGQRATSLWVDAADHAVARIATGFFADDVESVTGLKPSDTTNSADLTGAQPDSAEGETMLNELVRHYASIAGVEVGVLKLDPYGYRVLLM